MERYFLDTYALIEIIEGNEKFKKFLDSEIIICINNLLELDYYLIRTKNDKRDYYKDFFYPFCEEILLEDIPKANNLKIKNKKLSYIDCLGYVIAKRLGIKFVTGDMGFKNFDNVLFIKKD